MITSDKRIKQEDFGNITDYSAVCPNGMKKFFAYAHFTDMSYCLLSNIFAATRTAALRIALDRFFAEQSASRLRRLHRIPRRHNPPRRRLNPGSRLPPASPRNRWGFFLCICPILSNFAQIKD